MKRQLLALPRVLLYDPNEEHGPLDVRRPRLRQRSLFEHIAAWFASGGRPPETKDREERQFFRLVEGFDDFLDVAELAEGYTVAIDEAHDVWVSHRTRLDRLVHTVRHREQSWYLISHRLAWCPASIQSQLDKLVVFRMNFAPDLDTLRRDWGIEPDRIRNLAVGQFVEIEL